LVRILEEDSGVLSIIEKITRRDIGAGGTDSISNEEEVDEERINN
jgi:hypothetical protein